MSQFFVMKTKVWEEGLLNNTHAAQLAPRSPFRVITNQVKTSPCLTRKWKKLARGAGKTKKEGKVDNGKRRMSIYFEEQIGSKKYCLGSGSQNEENNFEVVAGVQYHQVI